MVCEIKVSVTPAPSSGIQPKKKSFKVGFYHIYWDKFIRLIPVYLTWYQNPRHHEYQGNFMIPPPCLESWYFCIPVLKYFEAILLVKHYLYF